jgi:hypothetical protein
VNQGSGIERSRLDGVVARLGVSGPEELEASQTLHVLFDYGSRVEEGDLESRPD